MQDNITIVHKKVKHVTIKVKPSLAVIVTAPFGTTSAYIDTLLNQRKSWIEKQCSYFKAHKQYIQEYVSGESVYFLGKKYRLQIIESINEQVKLMQGCIQIWVKNPANYHRKKRLLETWLQEKAVMHFYKILDIYSKIVGKTVKKITIRQMKTRWGSCNPQKSYINLNLALIKKSKAAIEYVVLHELTHLFHYNHDKAFYDYMTLHMPDWQIRRQQLNIAT